MLWGSNTIKGLLLGMMACAALAACTNDEIVEDNGVNQESNTAYMSVKIAMPDSNGGRAATDGGFEYGNADEQTISNAYCLFYNSDGSFATSSALGEIGVTPSTGTSAGNVEAVATATVILGPTNTFPTQVVTLLNIGDTKYAELKGLTLTQMLKKTAAYTDGYATTNNFIMSNSTYAENSKAIYSTPVTRDDFHTSPDASKTEPITIYVERLAAKVKVEKAANMTNTAPTTTGGALALVIDGWALNGTNKTSYYVKNLNEGWLTADPFAGWNSPTNFRCYWSQDPNYATGTYPANFEAGTAESGSNNSLIYTTWNSKIAVGANDYCLENTVDVDNAKAYASTTHALVMGHYTLNGKDVTGEAFYIYANNEILLEDALVTRMANMPNIYKKVGDNTYDKLGADDYKIVRATDKDGHIIADQVTIAVKAQTGTFYKKTGAEEVEAYTNIAAVNEAAQAAAGSASVYYEGKCYFPVKIEHLAESGVGSIGVVRNHIYNLTINSIKNLGVGVYDPNEVIVPGETPDKYYLSATLNILSWKVISQSVDL